MSNTTTHKVDPTVAYTASSFIPTGSPAADSLFDAMADAVRKAREAGRKPVLIEVTVRVAP